MTTLSALAFRDAALLRPPKPATAQTQTLAAIMLRTITTLLLFTSGTLSWGQVSETKNSLLNQLIDELKLEAKNYRQLSIDKSIHWDTSEYVFKKYLTYFDTTDQTDIAVKHKPTRRRIIAFSKLVTGEDYKAFREQTLNQRLDSLNILTEISDNKKSTSKMTASFSEPLITVDGKIAIIKVVRRYRPGEFNKLTTVYIWNEGKWTVWDHLERESLFY